MPWGRDLDRMERIGVGDHYLPPAGYKIGMALQKI